MGKKSEKFSVQNESQSVSEPSTLKAALFVSRQSLILEIGATMEARAKKKLRYDWVSDNG